MSAAQDDNTEVDEWTRRFHAGDKDLLGECYSDHFDSVMGAIGRYLRGPDQEGVAHDVFLRMVSKPEFREQFKGGSIRAWLCTVARNRAIDLLRKRGKEFLSDEAPEQVDLSRELDAERMVAKGEARKIIDTFRKEHLPEKWQRTFAVRFIAAKSQRDAAKELGISRTTLVYQEARIRKLLESYVMKANKPRTKS